MAGVKISALPDSTGLTGQSVPGVQAGTTVKTDGTLSGAQVITALGFTPAPINSPNFTGTPLTPTQSLADNSTQIVNSAWVVGQGFVTALTAPVTSVAGKTGDVLLVVGDVSGAAPIASPTFTGVPAGPTAAPGTNTTQLATTAFVTSAAFQPGLQWQNQGSNVGTPGSETVINAVGGGLVASISGGTLSLTADISMPANTIKGNNTGSTIDALNLTGTQVTAMLDIFTQTKKGLAPSVGITPTNNLFLSSLGTWITPGGGTTPGTVTSVDFTAPTDFSVSGNPITTAGTIALAWVSKAQNLVLATPDGSSGVPGARALVNADLPTSGVTPGTYGDSTHVAQVTYNAQGIATGVTNVAITAGGSGTVTSFSAGTLSPLFTTSVATATTTPALSFALSNAAAHTFFGNFTGGSTAPSFGSPVLASADFANQGTTTTVLHGNASGNPSFGMVDLSSEVTGNLGVTHLNSGTAADGTTFWRGDGIWVVPNYAQAVAPFQYGDGFDSAVTMDGVNTFTSFATLAGSIYTLTRDIFPTTLIINNGAQLNTNNFRINCSLGIGDCTGCAASGAIVCRGANGTNASGSTNGGRGSPNVTLGTVAFGGLGGDGVAGPTGAGAEGNANQTNTQNCHMLTGGAGGAGGAGGSGSGGAGGISRPTVGINRFPFDRPDFNMFVPSNTSGGTIRFIGPGTSGCGGSSGGGGGGANNAGGGGGGGACGGLVWIAANNIFKGTYTLINTSGSNGGNGGTSGGTNVGGGGGAGGGGGGWIILSYSTTSGSGTCVLNATAGNGGNAGNGTGSGTNGNGGTGGDGGLIQVYNAGSGTATRVAGSAGNGPTGVTGGTGGACTFTLP